MKIEHYIKLIFLILAGIFFTISYWVAEDRGSIYLFLVTIACCFVALRKVFR